MNLEVRSLRDNDLEQIKQFTDQWIGNDYYDLNSIRTILLQSKGCSLGAFRDGHLGAVRLTLAPGTWVEEFDRGLTPSKWKIPANQMAYFKSLFVAKDFQANGLGVHLSLESIELLKMLGAKGIICHSWLESPNNSSQRYLSKLGFEAVAEFPKFWFPIDYDCTRCAPKRCECTAMEMVKYI
ncbi:MAG: GNAT family N-acetyltransferase [Bdellovibrionales bacterium CG12_big_fil_rev_8_21_14_0_65_38_15]|nr:MAG: GNAT family N-acetyltransferase [Bdellovibrionales bacterium CG22_combo_CG10-13_8_21_14_all_38_13]PIQ57192.1 MAG: GNAT family N-acetyltransferase [Bdellovibrionales bacterium CG12_big_fil_rev_8_21_14_0_65_38_15]PIR31386.1 MAG: GNAT family N-acetyltransferase [Bdellovibrionales bacterium CG11_big_fil_rev_8_21_14_0_20_38_13]